MANYSLISIYDEDNNDYYWGTYETTTDQLIRSFVFEDDAAEYTEFLNDGGAFAGFTPHFILQEVAVPKDINSEFSANFA